MAKRILIVDDEPQMVMLLRSRLERCGYEVEEAFTGSEAYERLSGGTFDLMLLDFFLPDVISDDICRNVRNGAHQPALPIIIITGFSSRDTESFISSGATDVLFKPIKNDDLVGAVSKLI